MIAAGGGTPAVLTAEVDRPEPEADQIIVSVTAYSINRGETFLLERPSTGWRPGKDVVGRIAGLGAGMTAFAIGQRVLAHPEQGGWAEQVAVPVDRVARLPDSVSDTTAAPLPLAGLTALRLTRVCGPLASRRLLITGASGGVGHYLTELATQQGCQVTAVTASPQRGRSLLALGAWAVVQHVEDTVGPFDVAIESVGGDSLSVSWSKLRPEGRLIWMGQASRQPPTLDFFDWRGATSGTLRRFHYAEDPTPVANDLATLIALVARGHLHPEIDTIADWSHTNAAIEALLDRRVRGNTVLTVDEQRPVLTT